MLWKTRNKGFTLVELLVVIAIIATLSVAGIASFVSYGNIQSLNTAASDVVSVLQLAKSRSQSQVKPDDVNLCDGQFDGYEVVFSAPVTYSLYVRCGGYRGTNAILSKSIPSSLSFSSSTGLFFKVLTGGVNEVDSTGNTISEISSSGVDLVINQGSTNKTITIYSDGKINSN